MNLDKIRTIFPDFQIENFNMFDKIISLKWETIFDNDSGEEHRNLFLEMTCPARYKILIEFTDVNSWRFQGSGQIFGFYIKDMTMRGYENSAKYEIGDYEENEIRFYCSNVLIKNIKTLF